METEKASKEMKEAKTMYSTMKEWVKDIVKIGVIFLLLYLYVFQISTVDGSSMRPTFESGDVVIVDKLSFNLSGVTRGDVVVLKYPMDPSKDFIKRIIGMPGDVIKIRGGRVYVNGQVRDDEFVTHKKSETRGPWKVPNAHYFVLGDNRASSTDSRTFKFVPQDYVKGKVRMRVWPLKRFKIFESSESADE